MVKIRREEQGQEGQDEQGQAEEQEKKQDEGKQGQAKKEKKKINFWMISTIVLLIISIFLAAVPIKRITGHAIEEIGLDAAEQKVLGLMNNYLISQGTATSAGVKEESGLYIITIIYQNNQYPFYLTKDGKFIGIPGMGIVDYDQFEASMKAEASEGEAEQAQEIPKSDKPAVELFIMSYCPFGTQSEKAILPVWNLLKDKADFKIRFVYYAMHAKKELDENLRQYCIQKEQYDKFTDYAACFLKEGKYEDCLGNIDQTKLEACMQAADSEFKITEKYNDQSTWLSGRYPLCDIDKELNEKYDIRGSPTLVINGKTVSVTRSPEAIKEAVCSAFNTTPEECSTQLSTDQESAGFGYATGSSSGGQCS